MSQPAVTVDAEAVQEREIRVLLVDDSVTTVGTLSRLLVQVLPVSVAGRAYNGLDGLALAARLKPDLVISDLRMPGLDGFQLVERLRRQFPSVKSIIISADEDPMLEQACLEKGADGFIPKARLLDELPSLFSRLFPSCDGVLT